MQRRPPEYQFLYDGSTSFNDDFVFPTVSFKSQRLQAGSQRSGGVRGPADADAATAI